MIDAVYAKYDNSEDEELDFNYEEFEVQFYKLISLLERINEVNNVIKDNAKLHILYSIFTFLALTKREQILADEFDVEDFSNKLKEFLSAVSTGSEDPNVTAFKSNLLGANTEFQQRKCRFDAMVAYIG